MNTQKPTIWHGSARLLARVLMALLFPALLITGQAMAKMPENVSYSAAVSPPSPWKAPTLPGTGGPVEPVAPLVSGSTWHTARVDAPKLFRNMGDRSLRLDAAGHPHIAYGSDHLYHAWHDGTVWHLETVDASWQIQVVDAAGNVGNYTSLALDKSDHPRISYLDQTNLDLKYAAFDGSAWDLQAVDSAGWVGWFTSLALDGKGYPHISYCDWTNGDLKYATQGPHSTALYLPIVLRKH